PPTSGSGAARGTLGYAAPEALTGARTPAGDLFGMGATLFAAWTGAAPFGSGLPAVQRMLSGRAPALSSVRPGLSEAWDRIIDRLLAPDPRERTPSARQLLREIQRAGAGKDTPTEVDLGVPYPEGDPLEGLVVGRAAEREAVRAALERLADGAAPRSVVAVVGGPGSGRRTLIDAVAREVAVAVTAGVLREMRLWRGDLEALETFVDSATGVKQSAAAPAEPDADAGRVLQRRLATLAEALERCAAERPLCLIMPEGPTTSALAAVMAGAAPSGRLLLLLPTRTPVPLPFAENVVLSALTPADVATLVTRALAGEDAPKAAVAALVDAGRGHAALVATLARRLVAALRAGGGLAEEGPAAWSLATPGADLNAVLARDLAALSPPARQIAVAIALAGDEGLGLTPPEGRDAAVVEARGAGWIRRTPEGALAPASESHRHVALEALAEPALARLAASAADALGRDDPRRAKALAAAGRAPEAAALLRARAARAEGEGDLSRAAAWLEEVARLAPGALTTAENALRATGLGALGRYAAAAAALEQARATARSRQERLVVVERRTWLLARTGDLRGAVAELEGALEVSGAEPEPVDTGPLRARLGRLLVTMGRFGDALARLEPLLGPPETPRPDAPAHAVEAAVLAHGYLGQIAAARALLDDPRGVRAFGAGKRAYLDGLLAQLAGDGVAARDHYRHAYAASAAEGEVHTLAAVALNLGGLLAEQGLFGEALAATERAVRALGQLGSTAELGTALVNAANLFVQLGDLSAARRALDRADSESATRGTALARALVAFVEGDLARREGRAEEATTAYAAAAARFLESGQQRRAASATLARAEALALAARPGDAAVVFGEALATAGLDATANDVEVAQTKARLALAGVGVGEADDALAARAEPLARAEAGRGARPAAWRLAITAARLFDRSGERERARHLQSFAQTIFQEIRMASPEHHRPGLDADPDAPWLGALGPASPLAAGGDVALAARAAATESRLRRLLRINKRLNSELRLPRLLELIVDTVIELTDAERGFLLLEDDSGELVVKVARNIDQKTLETEEFELSRSIARRAAAGGEPIVTIDAAGDTRFREALSVSDLHLRSVLAVPLVVKGRAVGTIYADHRLRKGVFDDDDVRFVIDVADQAAIAIENARLLAELRRRERQVEALNRRLEVELAARGEELSGMKQELRENREALAVRYDYRNIVGRTPRMLELFRLLDRLTDTALPVV
ncbi:MAG TPA: GAF domain-containing protein, partial [Polyangia bacterium]|nr:GAF domain-containing protein [Polyangia bacterium]